MGVLTHDQIVSEALELAGNTGLSARATVWLNNWLDATYASWPWPFLKESESAVISLPAGSGGVRIGPAHFVNRYVNSTGVYAYSIPSGSRGVRAKGGSYTTLTGDHTITVTVSVAGATPDMASGTISLDGVVLATDYIETLFCAVDLGSEFGNGLDGIRLELVYDENNPGVWVVGEAYQIEVHANSVRTRISEVTRAFLAETGSDKEGKELIIVGHDDIAADDDKLWTRTTSGTPTHLLIDASPGYPGMWQLKPVPNADKAYSLVIKYRSLGDPKSTANMAPQVSGSLVPLYPNDRTMVQAVYVEALKHQKSEQYPFELQVLRQMIAEDKASHGRANYKNRVLGLSRKVFL